MSTPHVLMEVRTARESEHAPEVAVQLFATLPKLKNKPWHRVIGTHEQLSFEILVQQQTTTFLIFAPFRLAHYVQSLISASYPEAVITYLDYDPLSLFTRPVHDGYPAPNVKAASIRLKHQEYFPLKTFQDFKDVDPLVGLIATLSQLNADDQVVVQYLVSDDTTWWKGAGQKILADAAHPQRALAEKKLSGRALKAGLRIMVATPSSERSQILLDTVGAAIQAVSQSEGNSLEVIKPWVLRSSLVHHIQQRQFKWWPNAHFSLEELATLYHFPDKKLGHIPNIAWGKNLPGEPPEHLPIVTAGMSPEDKGEINAFAKTMYKGSETVYGLKRSDRRRHLYVIGKTGTGKSTLLANMAINDLKNDEGLCVIDPHGDLVETLLEYIPSRRINDVVYFDPADPDRTVKINLFEGENVAHRELIASGIVSIFQKLYAYSWGPRLEYILRNALLTLLKSDQARMSDILDLLNNPKFRGKIVEKLDDPILKSFWEDEYDKLPDRLRTESIAPILNKVGQFVSSPLVRNVVNANKSSFNLEDIMNEGKILLVNLSQGKLGEDNATLLGAMLITKIQLSAMGRVNIEEEHRRDFYLYVDEFQNFATTSFIKILSEARKYRLNLTLANQYIAQIPEEVQKAIFGNCGSIISFVMGADDAQAFAKEYGDKYTHDDLVNLGKHQIINKISIDNVISHPFPAKTLPIAKSRNQNKDKVIKVSRERYATNR